MKYKIIFIFILMVAIIPIKANAEVHYFNYSEYYYSEVEIEQTDDMEVQEVFYDGRIMYRYRMRDYIRIPDTVNIYYNYFTFSSVLETNIPLEEIIINEYYDLNTMNHCDALVEIIYGGIAIQKPVYISIDNYINIPKEIIVTNYNFDIWDYIDTNIEDREEIKFVGEYDLYTNGKYDFLVTYYGIDASTKIIVEIDENNKIDEVPNEDESTNKIEDDQSKNNSLNKEEINEETIIKNIKIIEQNEYITNYSSNTGDEEVKCSFNPIPINNRITYDIKEVNNKYFHYITYAFYVLVIIILSIIVVRKK